MTVTLAYTGRWPLATKTSVLPSTVQTPGTLGLSVGSGVSAARTSEKRTRMVAANDTFVALAAGDTDLSVRDGGGVGVADGLGLGIGDGLSVVVAEGVGVGVASVVAAAVDV